jgi:hypothetical protein
MKKTSFEKNTRLTALAMLIALAASVNLAKADWFPGQPAKWVQMPDLLTGMNVLATDPNILADDFLCMQTGPITDIHVWGSWLDDQMDPAARFKLSIHSDVPAGTDTPYSHPGPELWSGVFDPSQYIVNPWATTPNEPFYDPAGTIIGFDNIVWQYNFYIDEPLAFVQQGTAANPLVYWLDVQMLPATPTGGPLFGWKTSDQHWNDDATWSIAPFGTQPQFWEELIDQGGTSLDMAFVITTVPEPGTAMLLGLGAAVLLITRRRRV